MPSHGPASRAAGPAIAFKLIEPAQSGLIGEAEHDDAGVAAGRVAADGTQAAVQGDQGPSRCGGRR
jgi:hypothetical protein